MNTHRSRRDLKPGQELGARFFAEGTCIPIDEGCYVDGGRGYRDSTSAAVDVAYGLGCLTPDGYAEMKYRLRTDPCDDNCTAIGDKVVSILNAYNRSDRATWGWFESDLMLMVWEDY